MRKVSKKIQIMVIKMKDENFIPPAKVRYKGTDSAKFTYNKIYDAYFIEYWQGTRNSLHVKDDTNQITDFNGYEF